MLKKLHHKIVFMNMLLVGIVLLAVLAVFCYNEARLSRQMISDDLSRSIGFLQQTPFRDFREMFPQDDNGEYYFLTPYDEDDFDLDARSEDDDDRTEDATVWHVQQDMQQENGQKQIPGAPDSSTQAAGPQRDSSSLPSGTVAVAVSSDGAYLETYSNGFSLSDEELEEAILTAMRYCASWGITTVQSMDLGTYLPNWTPNYRVLKGIYEKGEDLVRYTAQTSFANSSWRNGSEPNSDAEPGDRGSDNRSD